MRIALELGSTNWALCTLISADMEVYEYIKNIHVYTYTGRCKSFSPARVSRMKNRLRCEPVFGECVRLSRRQGAGYSRGFRALENHILPAHYLNRDRYTYPGSKEQIRSHIRFANRRQYLVPPGGKSMFNDWC